MGAPCFIQTELLVSIRVSFLFKQLVRYSLLFDATSGKTTVDTADLYAINLDTNDSLKVNNISH